MILTRHLISLRTVIAGAAVLGLMHWAAHSEDHKEKAAIHGLKGEVFANCSLDSLSSARLWFHQGMLTRAIALDSLIFLRFPEHSHPSIGMLAGAAFGAAAGYLFVPGPSSEHWETDLGIVKLEGGRTTNTPPGPYVMWGGIVGGVLGYWIGSSIGAERIYDFRTLSMPVKIGAVTSVLRELAESSR